MELGIVGTAKVLLLLQWFFASLHDAVGIGISEEGVGGFNSPVFGKLSGWIGLISQVGSVSNDVTRGQVVPEAAKSVGVVEVEVAHTDGGVHQVVLKNKRVGIFHLEARSAPVAVGVEGARASDGGSTAGVGNAGVDTVDVQAVVFSEFYFVAADLQGNSTEAGHGWIGPEVHWIPERTAFSMSNMDFDISALESDIVALSLEIVPLAGEGGEVRVSDNLALRNTVLWRNHWWEFRITLVCSWVVDKFASANTDSSFSSLFAHHVLWAGIDSASETALVDSTTLLWLFAHAIETSFESILADAHGNVVEHVAHFVSFALNTAVQTRWARQSHGWRALEWVVRADIVSTVVLTGALGSGRARLFQGSSADAVTTEVSVAAGTVGWARFVARNTGRIVFAVVFRGNAVTTRQASHWLVALAAANIIGVDVLAVIGDGIETLGVDLLVFVDVADATESIAEGTVLEWASKFTTEVVAVGAGTVAEGFVARWLALEGVVGTHIPVAEELSFARTALAGIVEAVSAWSIGSARVLIRTIRKLTTRLISLDTFVRLEKLWAGVTVAADGTVVGIFADGTDQLETLEETIFPFAFAGFFDLLAQIGRDDGGTTIKGGTHVGSRWAEPGGSWVSGTAAGFGVHGASPGSAVVIERAGTAGGTWIFQLVLAHAVTAVELAGTHGVGSTGLSAGEADVEVDVAAHLAVAAALVVGVHFVAVGVQERQAFVHEAQTIAHDRLAQERIVEGAWNVAVVFAVGTDAVLPRGRITLCGITGAHVFVAVEAPSAPSVVGARFCIVVSAFSWTTPVLLRTVGSLGTRRVGWCALVAGTQLLSTAGWVLLVVAAVFVDVVLAFPKLVVAREALVVVGHAGLLVLEGTGTDTAVMLSVGTDVLGRWVVDGRLTLEWVVRAHAVTAVEGVGTPRELAALLVEAVSASAIAAVVSVGTFRSRRAGLVLGCTMDQLVFADKAIAASRVFGVFGAVFDDAGYAGFHVLFVHAHGQERFASGHVGEGTSFSAVVHAVGTRSVGNRGECTVKRILGTLSVSAVVGARAGTVRWASFVEIFAAGSVTAVESSFTVGSSTAGSVARGAFFEVAAAKRSVAAHVQVGVFGTVVVQCIHAVEVFGIEAHLPEVEAELLVGERAGLVAPVGSHWAYTVWRGRGCTIAVERIGGAFAAGALVEGVAIGHSPRALIVQVRSAYGAVEGSATEVLSGTGTDRTRGVLAGTEEALGITQETVAAGGIGGVGVGTVVEDGIEACLGIALARFDEAQAEIEVLERAEVAAEVGALWTEFIVAGIAVLAVDRIV